MQKKRFNKKNYKKFDFVIPLAALVGAPLCQNLKKMQSVRFGTIKTLCKFATKKIK